jgi:hypothetical protein
MSSPHPISAASGGATTGSENSASRAAVAGFRGRSLALRPLRLVLLACGLIALLLGLWTGMARLSVGLMGVAPQFVEFHGPLMICGFFGTLISIERAVALNRPLAYMIPIFAATGVFALLARNITLAGAAFLIASLALAAASFWNMRRLQSVLLAVTPSIAALCWGLGTLTWLADRPLPEAAGWWLAFLVLTVAAERLELSRIVAPPATARVIFAAAIAVFLIGVASGELDRPLSPFIGSGLILCGAWLLIYDLARRTVRLSGQIRFTALCMLLGYGWLIIAGLELLARPVEVAAFWYDAVVHAVTLGFVLSMVFGHTLIIFPSVVGLTLRYSPVLYVPLLLLQISVVVRTIGDFSEWIEFRPISGFLTIIALTCFAATITVVSICNRSDPQTVHSKANLNGAEAS